MSPASQVPSYKKTAQSEMGNETKNNLAKMKSENI